MYYSYNIVLRPGPLMENGHDIYRWTYLHGAVGVVVSMAVLVCFR